jgi:N-acetylmuramoyl-L-alanine amidase
MFVLGGAGPAAAAVPHTVVAGETLWSIAAANNFSTASLAAYNGLSPEAQVVLGSTIMIPAAGQIGPAPAPQATAPQPSVPQPSAQRSSSTQVGSIAAQHSTSPSLATGVAYQESGFNNSAVSSAGARGVMQIMPGTWSFIQENLTPSVTLNPYSAQDNVRAGVLYLDYLRRTMGSEDAAIGAYYQGPNSVRSRGLLPETEHYIANVRANQSRFAGTP